MVELPALARPLLPLQLVGLPGLKGMLPLQLVALPARAFKGDVASSMVPGTTDKGEPLSAA